MSATRFGYPNIEPGRYSNEQNLMNTRDFMNHMSEQISFQMESMENEIEELKQRLSRLEGR